MDAFGPEWKGMDTGLVTLNPAEGFDFASVR